MKIKKAYQCCAIIKPGEYMTDIWDRKQCQEKNPMMLAYCEEHENYYCLMHHWPLHLEEDHPNYNYQHKCGRKP